MTPSRPFSRLFACLLAAALPALLPAPARAADPPVAGPIPHGAAAMGTPDFSPEDCGFFKLPENDESVLCGYVSVPLHHGVADSPRIRLATVVLRALDVAGRQPDPLFLAQGGPGGSTIGGFARVLVGDPSKRPSWNRDLVLWDQRGTYFSQPRLRCREVSRLRADAGPDAQRDAYVRCGERLKSEAGDLSAFNSQENARDADAVRAALGYTSFNFYGVSYGTELGQFLMRERPEHLRSVVLDAVVPLGFSLVTDVPAVKQRVIQQYANACAQSPECNAAYPNLWERYLALIERLDKQPVELVPAQRGPGGETIDAQRLAGRDLDGALYQLIYMREAVPLVPYIIDRADQGDYSFVLNFVQLAQSAQSDMADGMYMTVLCAEYGDTPPAALQFAGVLRQIADSAAEEGRQILQVCRDWKIRQLDKAQLEPLRSDIPTLLLSGKFDPITPPDHAERVAAGLTRAVTLTFPRGTHGQAFSLPCANATIAAFLDAPDRKPDMRCAGEAAAVFYAPDQLLSLPVRTRGGSATVQDHLLALAGPALVVGLALALLFSAVPVYCVTEVVRIFTGRGWSVPEGWSGRLISAAPWIPVLSAVLLLGFLAIVGTRVGAELQRNQLLLLVGAVPAVVKSMTVLLLPYALALALMTVAMAMLWRTGARSRMGRVYYTAQVLAGWGVCIALVRTGLFGL
jgi:pimeloyl-ACP methyl ester carboxylesterase